MTFEQTTKPVVTGTSPSLMLIGGTKAGKTHYGGQLLRRLQKKRGQLRIVSAVDDLSAFQEVSNCLAEGRSSLHTPTQVYREITWQVASIAGEIKSELIWADYGGEQVEFITGMRQVPEAWVDRTLKSQGWMVFVRLGRGNPVEDILNRPRAREQMRTGSAIGKARDSSMLEPIEVAGTAMVDEVDSMTDSNLYRDNVTPDGSLRQDVTPSGVNLSDQVQIVELLQALLFVKRVGLTNRIREPALIIVMSCCDELPEYRDAITASPTVSDLSAKLVTPGALLRERLPLLSQFVNANWHASALNVVGVSALGKALSNDVPDHEFIDITPERAGWCILPNGERSSDLTLPVFMLMQMVSKTTGME